MFNVYEKQRCLDCWQNKKNEMKLYLILPYLPYFHSFKVRAVTLFIMLLT